MKIVSYRIRTDYASRQSDKNLIPIAAARKNKLNLWTNGVSNGAVKEKEAAIKSGAFTVAIDDNEPKSS